MENFTKRRIEIAEQQLFLCRRLPEVRLASVKAAIWRNKTETSGTRFNVKFSRIYKDGDAWKSTESFGRDDLLLLSKVADQTHSWIHQQEQWESGSKKPPVETNATPPLNNEVGAIRAGGNRLPPGSTGSAFHNSNTAKNARRHELNKSCVQCEINA